MKKLVKNLVFYLTIVSAVMAISGCGGGGGSSFDSFAKVTQSNADEVIALYQDTNNAISGGAFVAAFGISAVIDTKSVGTHSCSNGGNYVIEDLGSNKKKITYNNCKESSNTTKNGSGIQDKSNNSIEVNNLTLDDSKYNMVFSLSLKPNKATFKKIHIQDKAKSYTFDAKNLIVISSSANNVSLSGLSKNSKLNGWIEISTMSNIKKQSGNSCPNSGIVKLKGNSNYLKLKYTNSLNVDVYFNNDSSPFTSFNSCKDLPKNLD